MLREIGAFFYQINIVKMVTNYVSNDLDETPQIVLAMQVENRRARCFAATQVLRHAAGPYIFDGPFELRFRLVGLSGSKAFLKAKSTSRFAYGLVSPGLTIQSLKDLRAFIFHSLTPMASAASAQK